MGISPFASYSGVKTRFCHLQDLDWERPKCAVVPPQLTQLTRLRIHHKVHDPRDCDACCMHNNYIYPCRMPVDKPREAVRDEPIKSESTTVEGGCDIEMKMDPGEVEDEVKEERMHGLIWSRPKSVRGCSSLILVDSWLSGCGRSPCMCRYAPCCFYPMFTGSKCG